MTIRCHFKGCRSPSTLMYKALYRVCDLHYAYLLNLKKEGVDNSKPELADLNEAARQLKEATDNNE